VRELTESAECSVAEGVTKNQFPLRGDDHSDTSDLERISTFFENYIDWGVLKKKFPM
jgi:hypothetical protein